MNTPKQHVMVLSGASSKPLLEDDVPSNKNRRLSFTSQSYLPVWDTVKKYCFKPTTWKRLRTLFTLLVTIRTGAMLITEISNHLKRPAVAHAPPAFPIDAAAWKGVDPSSVEWSFPLLVPSSMSWSSSPFLKSRSAGDPDVCWVVPVRPLIRNVQEALSPCVMMICVLILLLCMAVLACKRDGAGVMVTVLISMWIVAISLASRLPPESPEYGLWLAAILTFFTRSIGSNVPKTLQKFFFGTRIKSFVNLFIGPEQRYHDMFKDSKIQECRNDWQNDVKSKIEKCSQCVDPSQGSVVVIDRNGEVVWKPATPSNAEGSQRRRVPQISPDVFPLKIVWVPEGQLKKTRYGLRTMLQKSWSDHTSALKESLPFSCFSFRTAYANQLMNFIFWTKVLIMHGFQMIVWSFLILFKGLEMNCVGYWLSFSITLRECFYFYLLYRVVKEHPACIHFNLAAATTKSKLLYIFSPEKYFLCALGESGAMSPCVARFWWLTITYFADYTALMITCFGQPPFALGLMLLMLGTGGLVVDVMGACSGNWGGTRVSTTSFGDSPFPIIVAFYSVLVSLETSLFASDNCATADWQNNPCCSWPQDHHPTNDEYASKCCLAGRTGCPHCLWSQTEPPHSKLHSGCVCCCSDDPVANHQCPCQCNCCCNMFGLRRFFLAGAERLRAASSHLS